jgi:hypothetical protein
VSDYTHGSEELNKNQQHYVEELNDYGKGYKAGQEDLYTWAYGIVEEWYSLKIVNDSQMLWLKELLHEIEKQVYYTYDGDK